MYNPTSLYSQTLTQGECKTLAIALLHVARKSSVKRGYFPYPSTDYPRLAVRKRGDAQRIIFMFQHCTICHKKIGINKLFVLPLAEIVHDAENFDILLHTLIEQHRKDPRCKPPRPIKYKPRLHYYREYYYDSYGDIS